MHHLPVFLICLSDAAVFELFIQSFKVGDLLTELSAVICISDHESLRRCMDQMHDRSVEHLSSIRLQRLIRLMLTAVGSTLRANTISAITGSSV